MLFKGRYVQVDKKTGVGLPDFSKLMPAFGYKYFQLRNWKSGEDPNGGAAVIAEFLSQPTQCALEVFMHPEQAFVPKVKGIAQEDGKIVPAPIEDMSPLLDLEVLRKSLLVSPTEHSVTARRDI